MNSNTEKWLALQFGKNFSHCFINSEIPFITYGDNGITKAIASFDSRCYILKFTIYSYNSRILLYLSIILIMVVIGISIFGTIKQSYKWFILNQALWNCLISYDYFCRNWVDVSYNYGNLCFESSPKYTVGWYIFRWSANKPSYDDPFSSLMLLTVSRFLCIYFPLKFEKLTKNFRIFFIIFGLNFFLLFTTLFYSIYSNFVPPKSFGQTALNYFYSFHIFEGLIFIALSIFSAIALVFKILKQSIYQKKHNIKDFYSSLRIAIVLAFQTGIDAFIFLCKFLQSAPLASNYIFGTTFNTQGIVISNFVWLDAKAGFGLKMNYEAILQSKVIIESLLILIFMTGYRENLIQFIKWIYFKITRRKSNTTQNFSPVSWVTTS